VTDLGPFDPDYSLVWAKILYGCSADLFLLIAVVLFDQMIGSSAGIPTETWLSPLLAAGEAGPRCKSQTCPALGHLV
jgi:hypothetical protein